MKILVTGGAGYIGSVLVQELIANNHEVSVIDSLENSHRENVDSRAKFYRCNLIDTNTLSHIITEVKPETIIHCAAYAYVGESYVAPEKYFINNVTGSLNLVTSAIGNNVKNIIFSSSCAVYGVPKNSPIIEESATNPINPYGETKAISERMFKWLSTIHNIKICCLRYFNVAGATLDKQLGEMHPEETHLIPNIFNALMENKLIRIYGNDYETKDGTCIRDYVHVVDLARAHLKVIEAMQSNKKIEFIYNLGSGVGHSNLELINSISALTGLNALIKYESRRLGDPPSLIADISKIKRDLAIDLRNSKLELIINSHWEWYKLKHVNDNKFV